jgi:hypothetical protein
MWEWVSVGMAGRARVAGRWQMADVGVNAESGRGLMLVDALSKEWSYFYPPDGGKTVYCVISTEEPAHMRVTTAGGGVHHDR